MAVAHRIYAEALFGAAKDAGRLAQVHEALGDFAVAIAESPELRAVLRNPQLEPSAKAAILDDLAGDEEPLFANFLQLVAEKGRAGELEEMAKEFERLMAREERRLTVELTTARELTGAEAKAILKQIEDAAGRSVGESGSPQQQQVVEVHQSVPSLVTDEVREQPGQLLGEWHAPRIPLRDDIG